MSVRVFSSHHKTNTTNTHKINKLLTHPLTLQLTNVLSHEALSFQELTNVFPYADEKIISQEVARLVESGVVGRHFHQNRVVYSIAKPHWRQMIDTLYGLWAEQVQSPQPGRLAW